MYAVLRDDLHMSAGKAASQAGHAFLASFASAPADVGQQYLRDDGGTKIVLRCRDESELRLTFERAAALGLPCHLWTESGHIMPPSFDGSPIVTAVGIGPVERATARRVTRDLRLL